MKRCCRFLLVALMPCLSPASWAVPIVTPDDVDVLVASTRLSPSNPENEKTWVGSIIGADLVPGTRLDESDQWLPAGTGVFVFDSGTGADYFLIRTGAGHPQGHTHFLYRNTANPGYAVIDLAQLGFDPDKVDAGKIGYYTEFRPLAVAEPGSLALLGGGLLGLGLLVRRPRPLVSA